MNLLRILAAESSKNVVIGDDVKGKMSITLKNVPWDLALDTILETRGLRKVEKDGVLRIVSNEQLIKEREAIARVEEARMKAESDVRAKIAEAQLKEQEAIDKKRLADAAVAELRARGPLREETIRLSYADPDEVAKTLQGILGIPPTGVQAQVAPVGRGDAARSRRRRSPRSTAPRPRCRRRLRLRRPPRSSRRASRFARTSPRTRSSSATTRRTWSASRR